MGGRWSGAGGHRPLAYVVGYQNFGIFFSRALFGSLMVLLLAWMSYRTLIQLLQPPSMQKAESEASDAEFDRFSLRRLALLSTVSIFSILLVQRLWRITPRDTSSISDRLSQPFEIGTITLVPSRLIVGVMIVLGFWIIARALQRSATNLLQARDPASRGARQSVITLMAYVIITLGFLFGLSAAGLELSNLAIIAGALSVGIGFGLQNIVSNFVSGIILLIERPISEGDWIEVGGQMGYVRDISVRSTRIETFDRTDVIIPNADLVSGTVTNYTRGNTVGRVIVPHDRLGLGRSHGGSILDERHRDGTITALPHRTQVTPALQQQAQGKDRQRNRHDELGGPCRQVDVERGVADLPGAQEMQPGAVDEHQGHQQHEDCGEQLREPEPSAVQMGDQDIHADMAALSLRVGNTQESHEGHGLFDPVDITADRQGEDPASEHIDGRKQHQQHDDDAAKQCQPFLETIVETIDPAQPGIVSEYGAGTSHQPAKPASGSSDPEVSRITR